MVVPCFEVYDYSMAYVFGQTDISTLIRQCLQLPIINNIIVIERITWVVFFFSKQCDLTAAHQAILKVILRRIRSYPF